MEDLAASQGSESAEVTGAIGESQGAGGVDSATAETQTSVLGRETSIEQQAEKTEEKGEEAKPSPRAPQEYSDFSPPEGMKLEGQDMSDFKAFARDQDLTQEQAQKVLEYAGPKFKAMLDAPLRAWSDLQTQWQDQVKSDPEIGGTKFEQSVKEANNVFLPGETNPFVKTQGQAQKLRQALNATGAGNNPEIVRLFVKMGRYLAEPAHLTGKPTPQNKQESLLNSMYPTMSEG